jgi:hypothetical protein
MEGLLRKKSLETLVLTLLQSHVRELVSVMARGFRDSTFRRKWMRSARDPRKQAGDVRLRLVARIVMKSDEGRLEVHLRKLPATVLPQPGVFAIDGVAGAGFEPATLVNPESYSDRLLGHAALSPLFTRAGMSS